MSEEKMVQLQTKLVPVHSDFVNISTNVKMSQIDHSRKHGSVRLTFSDTMTGQVVADVVLNPITAEDVCKLISKQLDDLHKAMKSKELPKQKLKADTTEQKYIG